MTSERHRMVVIDRCKSIGPTTCVQVGSIRLRIDPARPLLDGQSRRMSVAICFPCVAKAVAAAAALRWVRQVSEIWLLLVCVCDASIHHPFISSVRCVCIMYLLRHRQLCYYTVSVIFHLVIFSPAFSLLRSLLLHFRSFCRTHETANNNYLIILKTTIITTSMLGIIYLLLQWNMAAIYDWRSSLYLKLSSILLFLLWRW